MRLDTPAIYFHFPRPARPTFHMDGVAGPLVIAGIDPGCRILSVATMASGETGHRLPGPVCAALEIGAGHPVIARLAPGVELAPSGSSAAPAHGSSTRVGPLPGGDGVSVRVSPSRQAPVSWR